MAERLIGSAFNGAAGLTDPRLVWYERSASKGGDIRPTVAASCQADGYHEYADGSRVVIPRIEDCACHPKRVMP